ncbi:MAG: exodeoxyribonuclease VII large subunit [Thermoflexaceae bacterium]|nr:exodeoxyribonuclease VII large subunit [Thermoflexaceae bacterium]
MEPFTVSALVSKLRGLLEANEAMSDAWVVGEVSNYSRSQPGHRYFSLKDQGAVIRAVLFRGDMPGMELKDGDHVIAHGRVTVYAQRGELQLVCDFVRPEGIGIEAARFEELRERLAREGLFAPERKRPLPAFPTRVGVVTSPTGAALQDILNVIGRRWPLATVLLAPALVQGEQAVASIASALEGLAREPGLDVAILARGGGSAEDFSAFNDERIARAIFAFPVPVVTGIGHETDFTIADFVADLRAPTPSVAAERSTPSKAEISRALAVTERSMTSAARDGLVEAAGRVEASITMIERSVPRPLELARGADSLLRDLENGYARCSVADRARFETTAARIAALDPRATLERGFAIIKKSGTKKVVNSVRKVKGGDRLDIAVADGAFWAEVS